MRQIIYNFQAPAYVGNQNVTFEFNIWSIGDESQNPSFFVTIGKLTPACC